MTLPNGLAGLLQLERVAHEVLVRSFDAMARSNLWPSQTRVVTISSSKRWGKTLDTHALLLAFVLFGWEGT